MENNQTFKSLLTDGISPLNYTAMNNSFVLQSSLFDHHYHGDDLSYYNPLIDSYKRSFTRDEVSLLGGVGTELQEETANFMAAKAAGHGHGVQESLDDLAISVPHHMYSPCFVSNQDNSSYVTFENQYWGDIELDHLSGKTSEFHQTFDENVWNNSNNNNLFLSLATSQPSVTTGLGQCSDMSGSVAEPNSGNTEKIMLVSEQNSCHNSKVISGSKYLSAAQQILAHVAGFSLGKLDHDHHYCSSSMNSCSFSTMDSTSDVGFRLQGETTLFESHQQLTDERKTDKLLLLSLLQMVDDRYNKCLEEIHSVVSDPHIHARFALQTISVLYKGLRKRIKHCLAMEATVSFDHRVKERSCKEKGFETSFIQRQWDLRQLKKKQERLWIPQRGLPLKSVSVLKAWLFENFLHPYPRDEEKHWLAIKSGLTKIQVSNWFMNARGRLWKPMILEMEAELNKIKESNKNKRISINHKINQIQETINLD